MQDYANAKNREAWLRHPVLGDASFDPFERVGDTVHRSTPPYEWAVNTSLYRDKDGAWYLYAGLYPQFYATNKETAPSRFKIYRSRDAGASWEDLGFGFETGFCFAGHTVPSDSCPDVFLLWDEKRGQYLLTYDTSTNDLTWEKAHSPVGHTAESGAALAVADSPAGPFRRLDSMFLSNRRTFDKCGRWARLYASCVVPRQDDYIAFCLCDSDRHYAWGLAVMTAPAPEGPWSDPHMVLCCDTPGYYPCPMEFFPVEVHGDTVVAHATSVAQNRNYQVVFTAPLAAAHDPAAWQLTQDGSVWHARDVADEYAGIWGQTFHGFVEPETGRYVVAFPSKNQADRGTLAVAARPWDTPYTDGFTLTAHGGASVSPLLAAYGDFTLEAAFTCRGQADIAFAYAGVLGPADSCADTVPCDAALKGYTALRLTADAAALVTVAADGSVCQHASCALAGPVTGCTLQRTGGLVTVTLRCADAASAALRAALPAPAAATGFALVLAPHSRLDASRFAITGDAARYTLRYNAADALLGAGQLLPARTLVQPADLLTPDVWHRTADGYIGEGAVAAKWNVRGDRFTVRLQRAPGFGRAGIWLDGRFWGGVTLTGEGEACYTVTAADGRHAVWVRPLAGRIGILGLTAEGPAQ